MQQALTLWGELRAAPVPRECLLCGVQVSVLLKVQRAQVQGSASACGKCNVFKFRKCNVLKVVLWKSARKKDKNFESAKLQISSAIVEIAW